MWQEGPLLSRHPACNGCVMGEVLVYVSWQPYPVNSQGVQGPVLKPACYCPPRLRPPPCLLCVGCVLLQPQAAAERKRAGGPRKAGSKANLSGMDAGAGQWSVLV